MAIGQNPDELNIGLGLDGFEEMESKLERLQALLNQTAETAQRAFSRRSSSDEELAVRLANLDKSLSSTASRYASLGKAGAAGFEQINKSQLEAIERIAVLQGRLRDLEERRATTKTASGLAAITKEADTLEKELTIVQRKLSSLQTLDIAAKLRTKYVPTSTNKVEFQGPASPYEPGLKALSYTDPDLDKALKDIERMQRDRESWQRDVDKQEIQQNDAKYKILTQQLKNYLSDSVQLNRAHVRELKSIADDSQVQDLSRRTTVLATKYGAIGRPGSDDFDKINKFKEKQLDKLIQLQLKLSDLEKQRGSARLLSDLERISREANSVSKEIDKVERSFNRIKPIDVKIKATYVPSKESVTQKIQFQGPASPYNPVLRNLAAAGDKDLDAAMKDIDRMQRDRAKWAADIGKQEVNQREQTYKTSLGRLKNYFKDELALLKAHIKEKNRITSGTAGGRYIGRSTRGPLHDVLAEIGLPGLSGALGPIAFVAGVGYAAQKAFNISKMAIDRASEQARANRTLASSAAEAGIQLDILTEKNKQFADRAALSEVKATSTSARITQLATISQRTRPEDIDKLFKGFADLGAARGLDAEGIETVIQQIITGQDEGYKKLLLPNPSQLQARYAQRNNRTVSSLTAVEKAQIFQDEFLKKAALFNGAAEARLRSVDGQAAKLTATFEDLANKLSTTFASSYEVQGAMRFLTQTFKDLNYEVENLARLSEQGINIDVKIKEQAKPNKLWEGASFLGKLGMATLALPNAIGDVASNPIGYWSTGEAGPGQLVSSKTLLQPWVEWWNGHEEQNRENLLRQQVNAELLDRAIQRRLANERAIILAGERAEEDKLKEANKEKDRISNLYKRARTSPDELQGIINNLDSYARGGNKTLDTAALDAEVEKRFKERDIRQDQLLGGTPDKVKESIRVQTTKEFQEALEVSNLPLFDEQTLNNLRERGYEELSAAVSKIYNRVLSDPNLNISKLFGAIGQIKGDVRLFPEDQEALLQEAEATRQRFAQKTEDTRVKYGDLLANFYESTTDNPLVKFFYDSEKAATEAYNTFSVFGEGFAQMAAEMARQAAQAKIEIEVLSSKLKSLEFTQEARKLQRLEPDQYGGFQSRLQGLTQGLGILTEQSSLRVNAARDQRLATQFRAFRVENPYFQLRQQFDAGQITVEERNAQQQQLNLRYTDIRDRLNEARDAELRLTRLAEKFGNLGIEGQAAVARAKLTTLPSTDELLQFIQMGGGIQGRYGLAQRADLQQVLAKEQDRQLEKVLRDQAFNEQTIKNAREKVALLDREGTRLQRGTYLDQILSITGEIPTEDLPEDLRNLRIRSLDERAKIENQRAEEANNAVVDIKNTLDGIRSDLSKGGLKIDVKEKAIIEVHDKTRGRIRVQNSKYEED